MSFYIIKLKFIILIVVYNVYLFFLHLINQFHFRSWSGEEIGKECILYFLRVYFFSFFGSTG